MNSILMGLLGTLLSTNQPTAISNLVAVTTGASVSIPDANDPVEKELKNLMVLDDEAQEEVDRWILDNQAFAEKGAGVQDKELNQRIRNRFDAVRKGYEDFLQRHPDHARGRVAYGSFLCDLHDEEGAEVQLVKAIELNSKDPAAYNNLANIYGHVGPVKKSFEYYAKAIELNPLESIYYQNLGTTVFLFRKDAMEYYNIPEQKVFDKALELYEQAMRHDPTNFTLASDVAQTYYGIKPIRTEDALHAWTNAMKLTTDDGERQGVHIHFARFKLRVGRFAEAHAHLDKVTSGEYAELKRRVSRTLAEAEASSATNSAAKEKPVVPDKASTGAAAD